MELYGLSLSLSLSLSPALSVKYVCSINEEKATLFSFVEMGIKGVVSRNREVSREPKW